MAHESDWDFSITSEQTIESELRSLWRLVPISADAFARHAPITCSQLSAAGAPNQAIAALGLLLNEYSDDREIGAAGAAFGLKALLEDEVVERNVDERFFDFAQEYGRGEGRTARRWAERGTKKIARIIARYWEPRPQFKVTVTSVGEEFQIALHYTRNWSAHRVLAFEVYIGDPGQIGWGDIPLDDIYRIEEPDDDFEHSWERVQPNSRGSLNMVILWVCAVTPQVWFEVELDAARSGCVISPHRAELTVYSRGLASEA